MVELADALDSGSSVRKDVRVRIPPSAPRLTARRKASYKRFASFYLFRDEENIASETGAFKINMWGKVSSFVSGIVRQANRFIFHDKLP